MATKKIYLILLTGLFSTMGTYCSQQFNPSEHAQAKLIDGGVKILTGVIIGQLNEQLNAARAKHTTPTPLEAADLKLKEAQLKLTETQERTFEADVLSKMLHTTLELCNNISSKGQDTEECKEMVRTYQAQLFEFSRNLPKITIKNNPSA